MRKSIRPQSRRHMWIYDEDWEFISHHVASRTKLAPGPWVREMLHKIILQLREDRHLKADAVRKLLDTIEQQDFQAELENPEKQDKHDD